MKNSKIAFFILLVGFSSLLTAAPLQYLTKILVSETTFENPGTNWNAGDDDSIQINIGFDFPFNSTTYNSVWINSNGMLSFNSSNNEYSNQQLPRSAEPQSIYPYWDDLNRANGGTIRYGTLGNASNRHLVVSWNNVPHYPNSGSYSFQVVLYEDGAIRFRYLSGSDANGASATIGVQEDNSPSHFDQHLYNSASLNQNQDILYIPNPISVPSVTPNCSAPVQKIGLTTYNTTGYNSYPNNSSQYQTLINNYATDANLFDSGYVNQINGSGNPYGTNDNYLSIFEGYLYFPDTGIYKFGIDGDDAVEVYIDDILVTGWYGGHGRATHATHVAYVNATQGWHKVEFHHQEGGGGDNYYLYWQRPTENNIVIVPSSAFFHCTATVTKISSVISDPVNGTTNPKRIPGAVIRYSLNAKNLGSVRLSNVTLADTIPNRLDWVTNSIKVTTPDINGGTQKALTDASDGDEGNFNGTKAEVNCQTLKKNEECIVTFDVTVQ